MARPLQHSQAEQRIGLPPTCARKHRANGPDADNALTIKPDHPMGAVQLTRIGNACLSNQTGPLYSASGWALVFDVELHAV